MSGYRLRELFAELHAALERKCESMEDERLLDRSASVLRALLAEAQPVSPPEPVEPTDAQLDELWAEVEGSGAIWAWQHYARAVLSRWGRPAPEPVSVAERLEQGNLSAILTSSQPEPVEPTDAAWREFIEAVQHAQHVAKREGECPPFDMVATAFALWRSAAPEPVSLAERRPTAADCDGEGRCWVGIALASCKHRSWVLDLIADNDLGYWLPHWALPVPQEQADA
jgi:hypothetical protein